MKVTNCLYCGKSKLEKVTHRSDNVGIIRCTSCKVMMVDKISDDTESLYTSEYFEKDSDTKSGYVDYLSSPAVNVLGKFGLCRQFVSDTGRHLDLGAADGKLMEIFSTNGYETIGLEISQDAVDIAVKKSLNSLQSNLHRFPADIGKFDIITAFDLLEHADQPGLVLEQVTQHLSKDGYFVFSTLAVTKEDPSDYWFNHSLEHYVYYDEASLHTILTEKFGKGNYSFTLIEIHGISEFWGVAKNGNLGKEKKIIENISKDGFDSADHERGYYLTLFYNQLSKFETSQHIIDTLSDHWDAQTRLMARFYNAFYQGKYEEALRLVHESKERIGLSNTPYWQALAYINAEYLRIKVNELSGALERTSDLSERKIFAYKLIARAATNAVDQPAIHAHRPMYRKVASKAKRLVKSRLQSASASQPAESLPKTDGKQNVLITMPWMTFGGAETLVYNYCREIKKEFNISFVTGIESPNEWEYKFREISQSIYHLPSLIDDPTQYLDFVSEYLHHAQIDVLHIVHNGFMFEMLPELKRRHPNIRVIVTLFNDRVPQYVEGAVTYQPYIDTYTSDNLAVKKSITSKIDQNINFVVIPNGVNAYDEFNPGLFDRTVRRQMLDLSDDELAVFFVGRLSPEKNPDIFIEAAKRCASDGVKAKFFMVGDGTMIHNIEASLNSHDKETIKILGYQTDIAGYLSAADVFVLPSAIEGFPLSILEAMSMGVVAVASDVGAVSEIVNSGKDGYVITPGSASETAARIKQLADDPELLKSLKKLVRRKVEKKYSNKILKSNYSKLYRGV